MIFVDIDGTLLRTRTLTTGETIPAGWIEVEGTNSSLTFIACARPSAAEFLRGLINIGEVHAITTGGSLIQSSVLAAFGLRDLIGQIYGSAEISGRPLTPSEPWVLVDDEDLFFDSLLDKLRFAGTPVQWSWYESGEKWALHRQMHLITPRRFLGGDDPQSLTDLFPEIIGKLQLQSAAVASSI